MRSVYFKIVIWAFAVLILSFYAFLLISRSLILRDFSRDGMMSRLVDSQAEGALQSYRTGGKALLSDYLEQLQRYPTAHFLVDSAGRDLVTGADRAGLLAYANSPKKLFDLFGPILVAWPTSDPQLTFILIRPSTNTASRTLPYYLLVLGAVALMCWILALQFAVPLNGLASTVRRFGAGDLGARVQSKRRDEIGDVARAFDEMADRLETLLTAERRLLQDISHELRSPLARLTFAAELAISSADRTLAGNRLKKEIQRLTDLVGALLQVTRAEGDPRERNLETVPLHELLHELVDDCNFEAQARGCRFQVQNSGPLFLRGDRELLRRAIENIFRNAIRHAPGDSEIEIVVNSTQASASLSVRDYGPGVPAEALTNIFKPFFRADDARETLTGGVGLGLAITQRAVRLHHGSVWAENADPGLRVFVELPLEN